MSDHGGHDGMPMPGNNASHDSTRPMAAPFGGVLIFHMVLMSLAVWTVLPVGIYLARLKRRKQHGYVQFVLLTLLTLGACVGLAHRYQGSNHGNHGGAVSIHAVLGWTILVMAWLQLIGGRIIITAGVCCGFNMFENANERGSMASSPEETVAISASAPVAGATEDREREMRDNYHTNVATWLWTRFRSRALHQHVGKLLVLLLISQWVIGVVGVLDLDHGDYRNPMLGHNIPGFAIIAYACYLLSIMDQALPYLRENVPRTEARSMLIGGAFYIVIDGIRQLVEDGNENLNNAHVSTAMVWVFCGSFYLLARRTGVHSDMPMILAVTAQTLLVLHHPQHHAVMTSLHLMHAGFMIMGFFYRVRLELFNAHACLVLSGVSFIMSQDGMIAGYMGHVRYFRDPVYLMGTMLVGIVWIGFSYLVVGPVNTKSGTPDSPIAVGQVQYSPVEADPAELTAEPAAEMATYTIDSSSTAVEMA